MDGPRGLGWVQGDRSSRGRLSVKDCSLLPDPLQIAEDGGVKPVVRDPRRPVDRGEGDPESPAHPHDPPGTGQPVEPRELGVVPEPGQRPVDGVELCQDGVPCGRGNRLPLPFPDDGRQPDGKAQRRSEGTRLEGDDPLGDAAFTRARGRLADDGVSLRMRAWWRSYGAPIAMFRRARCPRSRASRPTAA